MPDVRFGLVGFPLGQLGVELDEPAHRTVTEIARAADALGFDFVGAQDHIVAPREWVGHRRATETWYDPFVLLGWTAAVTTRLRLLTDVIVLPYRSPFAVAKTAASLDVLSGGRLILGVAPGYVEREFGVLGAPFAERGAVTDEAIEVIKRCWTEQWVTTEGRFFAARDVSVSPRPLKPPPVWIGGNSLRALRRAAQLGDGWTPFKVAPEAMKDMLARAGGWLDGRKLDVAIPIRRGVYTEDGNLDVGSIKRQTDELVEAGATHLKIGFRGPTLRDHLAAMETFAGRVISSY